ncbi:diguanylate cyclase [Candidatus Woesearchaeota archaeon]|nr:diguanylate cyclase [Candidatus Woesearchaeota archaeon]
MELKDQINLDLWKQIQDKFAEVIDLPIVTIDKDGNEIVVSKTRPLFCQMIMKKKPELCRKCKTKNLAAMEKEGKGIAFYYCHAGLINIIVPIHVEGKLIGGVVCESIKKSDSMSQCQRLGKDLGVQPIELMDALKKIMQQKREDIVRFGTLLHTLSKTIPKVVHEKYQDEQKISELTLLQKIGQTLSSGLDLLPIIDFIIYFFEKHLNSKASVILIDNEKNEKKKYVAGEKTGIDISAEELKSLNEVMLENNWIMKKRDEMFVLSLPLKAKKDIIGAISLMSPDNLSSKIEFISIVCDQTALAITNAKQYEEIRQLAITDKLTGVFNRRELMNRITAEVNRSKRFLNPLSLIMLDLDNFSNYNNTFGHPEGDELLVAATDAMKSCLRDIDTIGRYGGEEFTIVLPETDSESAEKVAERIRQNVENINAKRKVTVSIGVVTSLDPDIEKDGLIKIADKALYEAKNTGKNKVVVKKIVSEKMKDLDEFMNGNGKNSNMKPN